MSFYTIRGTVFNADGSWHSNLTIYGAQLSSADKALHYAQKHCGHALVRVDSTIETR